ncbi:MAG: TonB family protein [Betaproteobacteria bacterium]|nr:TonB family protein [Betaproteobacteria bacterium]
MAWKALAPLGYALVASAALHTGALVALDALAGGPAVPGGVPGARPAYLHARLHGGRQAPQQTAAPMAASAGNTIASSAAQPGLIPFPLMNYLTAADLDKKPEAIGEVPLAYPAELPLVRHGSVMLILLIDEEGKVDKVLVEAASTPTELANLASRAFATARFKPGMRGNQAVKSRMRIEVTFEGE